MTDKLTVREWMDADMPELASLHDKMRVGYKLPESFGPLFCVRRAVVDESGKIVAAATIKLVGEAYLWVDNDISSHKRAKGVKLLNEECAKAASRLGLTEISAWIPPHIASWFGKVIEKLGWHKSSWSSWSVRL